MKSLLVYFSLAYIISWVIWLPLYDEVLGISNIKSFPYNHAVGGLGPMISAFITVFIFNGEKGISKLLKDCLKIKPLFYLFFVFFSSFLFGFLAATIQFFLDGKFPEWHAFFSIKEFPEFGFFTFIIYNLIFFGFGEEVGWRGFALPIFQKRWNAFQSSLILTIFWGIWHLPLFLYRPTMMSMDFAGILGWLFSLLTGSIIFTWLYNSSRGSILICAIYHAIVDVVFITDFAKGNIISYLGAMITVLGIFVLVYFKPKNLSKNARVVAD